MGSLDFLDVESYMKFAENPELTQVAFDIQKKLIQNPERGKMVQWSLKAAHRPELKEMYDKKYLPPLPTIEELNACPKDSLGHAFAQHLISNNIQLNFADLDTSVFYNQDTGILNYMATRSTRFHDVFHVIAGLGTSPIDEYVLFCFQMPQIYSPYHMILLSSGLLHVTFHQPEKLPELMEKCFRYFQMGKDAGFLFAFPFEQHWRTNLEEVRSMLKIKLS